MRPYGQKLVQLLIVLGKYDDRIRVVDDVLTVLGKVRLVDADRGGPGAHDAHVGKDPAIAGITDDVNLVARRYPEGHQTFGHLAHLVVEFPPGDRFGLAGCREPAVGRTVPVAVDSGGQHGVRVLKVHKLHEFPSLGLNTRSTFLCWAVI